MDRSRTTFNDYDPAKTATVPLDMEAVKRAYVMGATTPELAVAFGVCEATISRRLKTLGVRLRAHNAGQTGKGPRFAG